MTYLGASNTYNWLWWYPDKGIPTVWIFKHIPCRGSGDLPPGKFWQFNFLRFSPLTCGSATKWVLSYPNIFVLNVSQKCSNKWICLDNWSTLKFCTEPHLLTLIKQITQIKRTLMTKYFNNFGILIIKMFG